MIHNKFRYLMTLALLITAVTGAWAETVFEFKGSTADPGTLTLGSTGMSITTVKIHNNTDDISGIKMGNDYVYADGKYFTIKPATGSFKKGDKLSIAICYSKEDDAEYAKAVIYAADHATLLYTTNDGINGRTSADDPAVEEYVLTQDAECLYIGRYGKTATFVTTLKVERSGIEVTWDAATNTGTFAMPGSDVVLTPIYSAATVHHWDETETAYASLMEAFANVKDGDVIKLDWNVTLTEDLQTPVIEGGAYFYLDFNGYTISGDKGITLKNLGDRLIFTDSSADQKGGYKAGAFTGVTDSEFVFDGGRFNIGNNNAETLNGFCAIANTPFTLASGKEFVDIENAPDADGFYVRIDYKTYELTIGAGKFATFYDDNNVKLADGTDTNIGLYTIEGSGINLDNNTVTVTKVNDPIAIAGMPLLVYNGTTEQKTVTLRVTPVAPTAGQMWSSHFQGTATDKTFTDGDMAANDYYALSGGKAFASVRGTGTIAAHKCWLEFVKNGSAPARQLNIVFEDGETTGIEAIDNGQLTIDNYYDLNGRKVVTPTKKGVYINNGKKVVR